MNKSLYAHHLAAKGIEPTPEILNKLLQFTQTLPHDMPRTQRVDAFISHFALKPGPAKAQLKLYELYGDRLYSYAKLLQSAGLVSDWTQTRKTNKLYRSSSSSYLLYHLS